MNKRELEDAIRDEVAEWPGCSVEFENATGGGHPKAKLKFGELIMRRAYPGTPSDSYNGLHKTLGDMRRTLRQMGAERPKPEPSPDDVEKRYHKPNDGAKLRQPPAGEKIEPKPDLVDQLVDIGAVAKEKADAIRTEKADATPNYTLADPEEEAARERALAEWRKLIASIEDGIYFDLPDEIYHAVPALGSGSISDLIVGPGTFWRGSWLDPDRPELDEEATAAQIVGKAYHIARLEPEKFDRLYVRELSKADFPARGLITSDAAIKAELKARGLTQTIGTESTAERAQRLLDDGYEGVIMPLEKARWEETVAGRTPLKAEIYDQIATDMQRIRGVGEVAEKMSGGQAEVSVFWTDEHGLRCKARFDYLKPELWDDFKSFVNSSRKRLEQAIADAVRYNRYYIQAVHYRDAAEAIRVGGLQIKGEANDDQRKLIAQIQMRPEELECWYIFQEKGGVPHLLAKRFEFFALPLGREYEADAFAADEEHAARAKAAQMRKTGIHMLASIEIRHAKKQFHLYSEVYKPGQPWQLIDPIGTISDLDFNQKWLEGAF